MIGPNDVEAPSSALIEETLRWIVARHRNAIDALVVDVGCRTSELEQAARELLEAGLRRRMAERKSTEDEICN
jgi:hypothetical protein